ncbi:MAG: DUF4355 domain-containing protein [Synergistaceae bacterium]
MNMMFKLPLRFMAPDGDGETPPKPDKTFTQAELDAIVSDRLKREKDKYSDYDELKKSKTELDELKKSQMSEVEKLKAENEALQKKAAEKEAALKVQELKELKSKLCAAAGLKAELADRLSGEDETSIKKDIEELKKLIPSAPAGGGGTPPASDTKTPPIPTKSGDSLRDSIAAFYSK